jgi:hypothetical protein
VQFAIRVPETEQEQAGNNLTPGFGAQARAAHRRDAARRGAVVDLQVKLATWAEAVLFEVKTLHYSDRSTTPGAGAGTYGSRPRERAARGAANKRARAVPVDRVNDAQRLDRELWPDRQQGGTGPIECRLRELGGHLRGVKALVVGAFAELAECRVDRWCGRFAEVVCEIPSNNHGAPGAFVANPGVSFT